MGTSESWITIIVKPSSPWFFFPQTEVTLSYKKINYAVVVYVICNMQYAIFMGFFFPNRINSSLQ